MFKSLKILTDKRRLLLFLVFMTLILALIYLSIQRWPIAQLVLDTKNELKSTEYSGLYVNSFRQRDRLECPERISETGKNIKLGRTKIYIPDNPLIQSFSNGEAYRVTYPDGRTLTSLPGLPDLASLETDSNADRVGYSYRRLIDDENVSTRTSALNFILNVTPDDLSVWDSGRKSTAKLVALNLKKGMVPQHATTGYIFELGNGMKGYQVATRNRQAVPVYVHIVNVWDEHFQLIFDKFSNEQIDCILANLSVTK